MNLTDEQFREMHQPLHVPSSFAAAATVTDKIVFTLADVNQGTAEVIIRHLENLAPEPEAKPLIAQVRGILAKLYDNGRIAAKEQNGELVYHLHKITQANGGAVNPDLLAPGLD